MRARGIALAAVLSWFAIAVPAQLSGEEEERLRLEEQLDQGEVGPSLLKMMEQLQRQQQMLDRMSDMMDRQRKSIDELAERMKKQEDALTQTNQALDQAQSRLSMAPEHIFSPTAPVMIAGPVYGAKVQYDSATRIYRTAIFDIPRRRDAEPYFERAAKEYAAVVEQYPQSDEADDAQLRVCKIYKRWLKRDADALRECQKFVQLFPNSEFIPEIREYLAELGASPAP